MSILDQFDGSAGAFEGAIEGTNEGTKVRMNEYEGTFVPS